MSRSPPRPPQPPCPLVDTTPFPPPPLPLRSGSGVSNTTKATSTDNSSRHSAASTAPSSTDFTSGSGQDDGRCTAKPPPLQRPPPSQPQDSPHRGGSKSSFLDRATRTFSFGGQKKQPVPPPKDPQPRVPDMPPVLLFQGSDDGESRSRGMTASTVSTATPANQDQANLDLGGDFGSMFTGFDKRASTATIKNDGPVEGRSLTGVRQVQAPPRSPDSITPSDPLLGRQNGASEGDASPIDDVPPPVPRHQQIPGSFKYSSRRSDIVDDEDARLLKESFTAMKFLSDDPSEYSEVSRPHRYRRDETNPIIASAFQKDDNMFEGSVSRLPRAAPRRTPPPPSNPAQHKVMTPAQFEKYRQDKERQGTATNHAVQSAARDEDEEDDINYDDDEDEHEKTKQQAKQRRKQEAHMAVYRQQMMKVTGEAASTPPLRAARPGLVVSSSAPQLSLIKAPSPDPGVGGSDEDDDEDVPLGILQAHGFPGKNRPPTRLSHVGSSSNLRSSSQGPPPGRPGSALGDTRRHSTLPAFARNLPQDPFVGASISRPAVRESLSFGGDTGLPPRQQGLAPPGGLVGVIVNEERSRALRRGSPNIDGHHLVNLNGPHGHGIDPITGIPPHMMYSAPPMPQPTLTPGDQAQMQMTQHMHQFMQMQMQFMQMMAVNQNGGAVPPAQQPMPQPMPPPMAQSMPHAMPQSMPHSMPQSMPHAMPQPMQQSILQSPYGGNLPYNQSMADLPSRHSLMGDPLSGMEPRRLDYGMRTMSMVQPSSASFMQQPRQGAAPSIRASMAGYTPSIAPSERSNIGLPGRYRPVSVAPSSPAQGVNPRASTMSGGLSGWSDDKSRSTIKAVAKNGGASDDEDEEKGWEAMKAKREKKRSLWRSKKSLSSGLAL